MFGHVYRIVTENERFGSSVGRLLAPFHRTTKASRARDLIQIVGDPDDGFSIYKDCARICSGAPPHSALPRLIATLNSSVIEDLTLFAVHSGGAQRSGRLVALPAQSGDGKTTLTGALVRAGFDFLSDEALVFQDDGNVIPYPKPLAISRRSAEMLDLPSQGEETLFTAEDLGGNVGHGGRLTDLILSEYGHRELTIEPLPKSQAVAALIQYSFNHYKDPARAFRIATDVARDLRVWRLEYDDPLEAADLISNSIR